MSSLAVFLALPADYTGPALQAGWHSLSVPSSAHSVKPFLAHLRSSLAVDDAYGFKLSVRSARGGAGQPSPVGAADAKAITTLAEFQSLFEQLEWAEDAESLTLVVELKKKEGATPAAAVPPAAAAPRFIAPSKATAKPVDLTPVAPSSAAAAAPAPVSTPQPQSVSMSERDPNYKSPFTQGSSASTSAGSIAAPSSTWARQQNESAQSPTAGGGAGAAGVAARLAMFGGASIAAGNRVYNNAAAASTNNSSSAPITQPPPPAAKVFTPPTASPPAPAAAAVPMPPPPPPSVAAAPAQPSASPAALVESLRAISFAAPTPAPAPAQVVPAAAVPSFVPTPAPTSAPVFGGFGGDDPDLDLPPPPSGFSDPFATASAPAAVAPAPGAAAPAPTVFGGVVTPTLPSPPASTGAPGVPVASPPAAAQSSFLSGLKANHALLSFQFAHDSFRDMIALCTTQERLFDSECASGVLCAGSSERERGANGLLLYLYHLFLAHTSLHEFAAAVAVSRRFVALFESLPLHLRAQSSNKEMHIQLRYNAGLAHEKAGQTAEALQQLTAAAALVDEDAGALSSGCFVPLRSEVCSALGNLLVSVRDLEHASQWHRRAVDNEAAQEESKRKWSVFHAAASCAAMQGQFLQAAEWDTKAIDLHQANPRVYFNRGLCLQKLNQWSESVADFSRVVTLDPSNAKGFVLRAKALLRQERWADVVADCEAAIKLAPQDAQAREFKEFAMQRLR